MGGMHTWIWAQRYPGFMDIAVPMAATPTQMSGRNWMLRRLLVESIKSDPAWNNGNYTQQPGSLRLASVFFGTATSGGNHSYFKAGPRASRPTRRWTHV
jgi:homoserine O-acetyltransferase